MTRAQLPGSNVSVQVPEGWRTAVVKGRWLVIIPESDPGIDLGNEYYLGTDKGAFSLELHPVPTASMQDLVAHLWLRRTNVSTPHSDKELIGGVSVHHFEWTDGVRWTDSWFAWITEEPPTVLEIQHGWMDPRQEQALSSEEVRALAGAVLRSVIVGGME